MMKKLVISIIIILHICFFVLSLSGQNITVNTQQQMDSCVTHVRLGISFTPLSDPEQMQFSQEHLDTLNVSMFRFAESWKLREAVQGIYNWGPLDARFNWIEQNAYSVLLTIQSDGPDWACNPALQNSLSCAFTDSVAFRYYIDSLLIRYGTHIDKIQFGNEWHSSYWYAGYANDFIRAHNTLWASVQTHAPNTKVVLGGFASGTMTSLAACYGYLDSVRLPHSAVWYYQNDIDAYCNTPEVIYIGARQDSILTMCHYDMVDMHLYDDVELWPLYYHIMDSITGGNYPIIVSEMGGPNLINEQPYSDAFQAQRLYQYIKCVDSLQIPEAYYYKMVSGGGSAPYHQESGLIDGLTLTEKPAYYVFKAMNKACDNTGIKPININPLVIYPNPSNSHIYVDCQSGFMIYNLTGQCIMQSNQPTSQINISDLPTGVYILRTDNKVGRFIKTE